MCVFIRITAESDRGEESSYKAHYGQNKPVKQMNPLRHRATNVSVRLFLPLNSDI